MRHALLVPLLAAVAWAEEPFSEVRAKVTRVPSQVVRFRPVQPAPRCVLLSEALFHRDTGFLDLNSKSEFRLAGDGDTLALLEQVSTDTYRLRLFRRGKQAQVFELRTSLPNLSRVFLADRGDYAVLAFRDAFAVFAGASLVGEFNDETTRSASVTVLGGDVFWCPRVFPFLPGSQRREPQKDIPLCYRQSLAGGRPEPFFLLDAKRLHSRWPLVSEWNMRLVGRPDGKLWLLGTASTEVVLMSSGGRILRREWLPVSLYDRSQDQNPEVKNQYTKELEEDEKEAAARAEQQWGLLPPTTDATRPPRREVPVTVYRYEPLVSQANRRGRDMVLTAPLPEGKSGVFLLTDGTHEVKCWVLPSDLPFGEGASLFASTDHELWFPQPLGYFRWSEMEALWDEAFASPENKGAAAAGGKSR
ncbi:MAG: hypothetical protein ACK42L_08345 [Thermoanaerobaculum sp.]